MRASRAVAAAALFVSALSANAQGSAPTAHAEVSFHFVRPGLAVPQYVLTIREDGSGAYEGVQAAPALPPNAPATAVLPPPQPFQQSIIVSTATAHRVFALAHGLKEFNANCATKAKNIADTGAKTFSYRGPGGNGSCTFNYSDNKSVTQLTDLFMGMAETMDQGRVLDHLHRYDRLGLDAAISSLADEVTQGRALELCTIAATLRSIAADPDLMDRVRLRASKLLSLLPPELQTATP